MIRRERGSKSEIFRSMPVDLRLKKISGAGEMVAKLERHSRRPDIHAEEIPSQIFPWAYLSNWRKVSF